MSTVRRDRERFGLLIEQAMPRVRGKVSLMMLRKFGDAAVEDVLQNAALNAWKYRAQFEGRSKFTTWFTRIAINEALMWMRKAKVKELKNVSIDEPLDGHVESADLMASFEETLADPHLDPEALVLSKEVRDDLVKTLERLSSKLRQVFLLRSWYGLNTIETVRALGISQSTVKTRNRRAKFEIRDHLMELR